MPIERIAWDSHFLGIEVGRTSRNQLVDAAGEVISYDLLYLFEDQPIVEWDWLIPERTSFLTDCKVIYAKPISPPERPTDMRIKEYKNFPIEAEQFYKLAYLSGEYSRYKRDPFLPRGKFEEMYRLWIDNSILGQIADHLFYLEENGVISAFVTLKITPQKGTIGLIATNAESRGKGLGTSLIAKCEAVLLEKKIPYLEVATQKENRQACTFYEKCNMNLVDCKYIYHSWK